MQWLDAKYLLGCAVFVYVLTPCAIFSKVMQSNEPDILAALTSFLRTVKETEKLRSLSLAECMVCVLCYIEKSGGGEWEESLSVPGDQTI